MFIKFPKGTLGLGVIMKEFLEEYCIILGKLMHGNVDTAPLWLILVAKYLINKCKLKIRKVDF